LAEMIADLEGGSEALITSSGNAAVFPCSCMRRRPRNKSARATW
jgi:O-acetylhomoserine/O-acetylserine sulfhydrylase-like pyridoxal-dependent enzyme